MLVEDLRAPGDKAKAPQPKPGNEAPFEASAGARGTTLFEWKGSMSMDRPTGVVHLNDHVEMRHRDDPAADQTRLECEKLTAYVREVPDTDKSKSVDSFTGDLTSADAEGAVWLQSGAHELVADTLHYDALSRLVNAKATGGNVVTIFDTKTRAPITAREIEWDLVKDRIVITKPGTTVAPVAPGR